MIGYEIFDTAIVTWKNDFVGQSRTQMYFSKLLYYFSGTTILWDTISGFSSMIKGALQWHS